MTKDPFTHQIIGLAMETHRALGPGLIEEAYHQDLVERLTRAGIEHLSKPRQDLVYRGYVADSFEPDLVFPGKLIAELKALRDTFDKEHFKQLLCYHKFWRIRTGLLFDFGKPSLAPVRVVYTSRTSEVPDVEPPPFVTYPELATRIVDIARRCVAEIGLGYRETTWSGIVSAALRAEGINFVVNPVVALPNLGRSSLRCFVIDGKFVLSINALGPAVSAIDRAYLQTSLRWLNLPWGMVIQFGKATCDLRYVSHPQKNPPG